MPNSRRRKFSIQSDLINPPTTQKKTTRSTYSSKNQDVNRKRSHSVHELNARQTKSSHSGTVPLATTIPEEDDEGSSGYAFVTRVSLTKTVDQEVEASSSAIDLIDLLSSDGSSSAKVSSHRVQSPAPRRRLARQDKHLTSRREKVRRQHCVTVRSPKWKPLLAKITVALSAISLPEQRGGSANRQAESQCSIQAQTSSSSLDVMCRICHGGEQMSQELGALVSACSCRGTVGRVHVKCLERWLTESGKSRCELCGTKYATRRVHKYGLPRALFMWLLSQNAKQLIVDSLGIMLMSPLAILAAWLSGRTLAGLMEQDSHVTPWPLASTFVLACMTLVCYYCWIVSAASRHALGWWLWYRAQYEVRLELEAEEMAS